VNLGRRHDREGHEHIDYWPGATMLEGVREFLRRYPTGELDGAPRAKTIAQPRVTPPPSTIVGGPPSTIVQEPEKLKDLNFLGRTREAAPVAVELPEEEEVATQRIAQESAVARESLVAHYARKDPSLPRPRVFDARDVALVAARVALLPGDLFEQVQANVDAIDGAWSVSKGAPSIGFVWGEQEHFVTHWKNGRARRLAAERAREEKPRASKQSELALAPELATPADVAAAMASLYAPGGVFS
jgi:hypothetical protein